MLILSHNCAHTGQISNPGDIADYWCALNLIVREALRGQSPEMVNERLYQLLALQLPPKSDPLFTTKVGIDCQGQSKLDTSSLDISILQRYKLSKTLQIVRSGVGGSSPPFIPPKPTMPTVQGWIRS
jgi:hypothetical protein